MDWWKLLRRGVVVLIETLLGWSLLTAAPTGAGAAASGEEPSAAQRMAKRRRAGGIVLGTFSALSFAGAVATGLSAVLVDDDSPHGFLTVGLMAVAIPSTGITIGTAAGAGKLLGRGDGMLDRWHGRARRDHRRLALAGVGLTVIGGVSGTALLMAVLMSESMPLYTLTFAQVSFAGLCGAGVGMLSYRGGYANGFRVRPIAGREVWGVGVTGRF